MKPDIVITRAHEVLSVTEANTLAACEADISKGGDLIATALLIIRDQRLYRVEFDTFEEYCRARLGRGRNWANKQIMHIEIVANIAENLGTIVPKLTEGATRELADLPPEAQAEVVREVVKSGEKPTAKAIKAAREKVEDKTTTAAEGQTWATEPDEDAGTKRAIAKIRVGGVDLVADVTPTGYVVTKEPWRETTEQEPAATPLPQPTAAVVHDILGRVVPPHLVPAMETAAEISALRNLLTQAKKLLNKLRDQPGGEYVEQSTLHLDPLDASLKQARFATTCPECHGTGCNSCRFRGWLRHGHNLSERQLQLLADYDLTKMGATTRETV